MMVLAVQRRPTPVGELLVVQDDTGALHAIEWADHEARMLALLARHRRPAGYRLVAAHAANPATEAIGRYLAGELDAVLALPTAAFGTAFQRAVWAALRAIPAGARITYAGLAASVGRPAAIRAAAAANGCNPVSIVVPCHRVVAKDGALAGYGSGLARKRWLLDHEQRNRAGAGHVVSGSAS